MRLVQRRYAIGYRSILYMVLNCTSDVKATDCSVILSSKPKDLHISFRTVHKSVPGFLDALRLLGMTA